MSWIIQWICCKPRRAARPCAPRRAIALPCWLCRQPCSQAFLLSRSGIARRGAQSLCCGYITSISIARSAPRRAAPPHAPRRAGILAAKSYMARRGEHKGNVLYRFAVLVSSILSALLSQRRSVLDHPVDLLQARRCALHLHARRGAPLLCLVGFADSRATKLSCCYSMA